MDKADGLSQARQNLADYLHLNSLRNTPERNALLEAIYQTDAALQADELSEMMSGKARSFRRIQSSMKGLTRAEAQYALYAMRAARPPR